MEKLKDDIMCLVSSLAHSDSQIAFKSLYISYFGRLMRFVSIYVESTVVAEEIVSDTFLGIWENRKSLPEVSNFDAYIFSIARNKCISYYRSKQISTLNIDEIATDLFFHTETTPEDDFISKETIRHLNEAIDSLPKKCKVAFKLVREDKMKYKDAAKVLDISVKTLEAHMATAVRKLREALNLEK